MKYYLIILIFLSSLIIEAGDKIAFYHPTKIILGSKFKAIYEYKFKTDPKGPFGEIIQAREQIKIWEGKLAWAIKNNYPENALRIPKARIKKAKDLVNRLTESGQYFRPDYPNIEQLIYNYIARDYRHEIEGKLRTYLLKNDIKTLLVHTMIIYHQNRDITQDLIKQINTIKVKK